MGAILSRLSCRQNEEEVRSEETEASRYDETRRRESVFYDARESVTKSMFLEYAAADAPLIYPRGSIVMDDPKTLLRSIASKRLSMASSVAPASKRLSIIIQQKLEKPRVRVEQRGYPGDLMNEELDAALTFRRTLARFVVELAPREKATVSVYSRSGGKVSL